MPFPELLILVVFCAAASVTHSISGFGFGVVLAGVLAWALVLTAPYFVRFA